MIGHFSHHRPPRSKKHFLKKHPLFNVQPLKTTKIGTRFRYLGGQCGKTVILCWLSLIEKFPAHFFYYFGGSDLGGSGCCAPTAGILNDYFGADRHGVGPPPTAALTRPNDRWPLWNLCILSNIPPTNCRKIRPLVGFIPRLIQAPLRGKCK